MSLIEKANGVNKLNIAGTQVGNNLSGMMLEVVRLSCENGRI